MQLQTTEKGTVRDSIAASIDRLSDEDNDTPQSIHADTPTETQTGTEAATGETATGETGLLDTAKTEAAPAKTEPATQSALTDTPARPATRGPASWKPDVREKWATLPPEVQAEVSRREAEIQTALQTSAAHRQFAEQFSRAIQPYQHIVALEGNDPIKSFEGYMRTAALLRTGTQAEKANAIADAIAQFNVDIALLDSTLQHKIRPGSYQPQQNNPTQPAEFRDPRLDGLLTRLEQQQAENEAAQQAAIDEELQAFKSDPANEFFDDLRVDIADILNLAAQRGQKLTLKQAYDKAANLNPDISKVIQQRSAAQAAEAKKKEILAKRNAGSSITGIAPRQAGAAANESNSVRSAIEKSIESLSM